jgi:hypothetical protein
VTCRVSFPAFTQASSTSGLPDEVTSLTSVMAPSSLKRIEIMGGVGIWSGAMPAGKL